MWNDVLNAEGQYVVAPRTNMDEMIDMILENPGTLVTAVSTMQNAQHDCPTIPRDPWRRHYLQILFMILLK